MAGWHGGTWTWVEGLCSCPPPSGASRPAEHATACHEMHSTLVLAFTGVKGRHFFIFPPGCYLFLLTCFYQVMVVVVSVLAVVRRREAPPRPPLIALLVQPVRRVPDVGRVAGGL